MKRKRPYESALRRDQTIATRERILAAVQELLLRGSVAELTIPQVAATAQLTVRTVYRYFPTRTALIDAMQVWALERMRAPPWPADVAELLAFPVPLFAGFDQNRALVEAQLVGAPLAAVGAEGRARRVLALEQTLSGLLARLPRARRRAVLGVVKHLLSASAWHALREDVGMNGVEAGEAVAWAIGALVRDIERTRSQRAGGPDGNGDLGPDGAVEGAGRRARERPARRARLR